MIETSTKRREARSRSQSRAGWIRQRPEARAEEPAPRARAGFDRARWRKFGTAAGLVGLTAVTSWVVSSISLWLVPVYVGAMVLIFAAPRKREPEPEDDASANEAGESSSVENATTSEPLEAKASAADEAITKPPDPAGGANAEPPAEAPPKPRKRRRTRARRTAKKAADAADAASELDRVTWVRVGPGKFVRSVAPAPAPEFVGPPAPEPESDPAASASAEVGVEGNQESSAAPAPDPVEEPAPVDGDSAPSPDLESEEPARQGLWINPGELVVSEEISEPAPRPIREGEPPDEPPT